MIIHFRSKFSHHEQNGNSFAKKKNSWNDVDFIRPYTFWNDAKNIFWKKSSRQIVEKTFEDSGKISLITGIIDDFWDEFETEEFISKKDWKEKSEKIIFQNARHPWLFYKNFSEKSLENFCKKILKHKIEKHLIIIFCNDWSEENLKNLKKISHINEIIWISSYHFFEKNPNENTILEGKILPKKNFEKYLKYLENEENFFKKNLNGLWISYLSGFTHEKIENILNQFFKYQYAKK